MPTNGHIKIVFIETKNDEKGDINHEDIEIINGQYM